MSTLLIKNKITNTLSQNITKHRGRAVCNTVVLFDSEIPLVETTVYTLSFPNTKIRTKKNRYGIAVYLETFM